MHIVVPRRLRLRSVMLVVAILASLYIIYFAGLGKNPLLDPDEPIYGQFAKEMVARGDWLTPHYGGELWFDKPPLFYWLSSICVKVLGVTEFAIRMSSAIFAALTVLMVYLLACYDFGKKTAKLASVIVGTTLLQIIMSHAAATDTVMVFFMTAALYAYRRWIDSKDRARLGWIAACGAAAGFGMLTKGPMVPLLLSVTFVLHLTRTRQLKKLRLPDVLLGTVAALGIGLPWYVAMYIMHGSTFVDQFIIANNITRFLKPLHQSQTGHWYSYFRNIPMLLIFFLPWSVFLPQALIRNWRINSGAKLAFCWATVVFVFFSMSKTQNFTYMLPAYPACALLVGAFFNGTEKKGVSSKTILVGLWVGLTIMLLIAAALFVVVHKKFPQAMHLIMPTALVLVSVFLVPLLWTLINRSKLTPVPWMIASGMVAFSLITMYILMPGVSDYKSSRKLASHISNLQNVRVVAYNLWRPSLFYYLERKPYDAKDIADIRRLASHSKPVIFVCRERDERQIQQYAPVEIYGNGDLDVYANKAYLQSVEAMNPPLEQRKATEARTSCHRSVTMMLCRK